MHVGDIVRVYWKSYGWMNGIITRFFERCGTKYANVTCVATIYKSKPQERLLIDADYWKFDSISLVKNPNLIRDIRSRTYLLNMQKDLQYKN
jgi:hypothetical protein